MNFSKVAISTSALAAVLLFSGTVAHADTPKQSTHDVAVEVIKGHYGTGQDRINRLTNRGFDAKAVQSKVNDIMLGEASVTKTQPKTKNTTVKTTPKVEAPATQTPAASTAGIDLNQTSGVVDSTALGNYMASHTANAAGYSASEWTYIIDHESHGSLTACNPTSGAYGVFQLLGHGEYAGMPLSAQIALASQLPAGSWVVYD